MRIIIILAIAGCVAYLLYKKSSESSNKALLGNNLSIKLSQQPNKNQIKHKIIEYFDQLSFDRGQYELYGFYKRQFDLSSKGFDKSYEKGVKEIGSLYDLGLQEIEIEAGRNILKDIVNEIANIDISGFTESKCLIFLIDYYEIVGKLNVLKEIKDIITDQERFERYISEEENRKKELIENLT